LTCTVVGRHGVAASSPVKSAQGRSLWKRERRRRRGPASPYRARRLRRLRRSPTWPIRRVRCVSRNSKRMRPPSIVAAR